MKISLETWISRLQVQQRGITAIQMDIKIHGLTRPIVEGAIARCREARLFIMDTCMKPAISEPP